MAYGSVISLKQTIQRLVDSSRFSLDSSTRENLGSAYEKAAYLQGVLKRLDDCGGRGGKSLDSLDGQIREAVQELEDFIEFSQCSDLSLDSEQVMRQEISRFAETAEKLGEDYTAELDNLWLEEEDVDDDDDDDDGVEMVGYTDEIIHMIYRVGQPVRPDDWGIMSIVGIKGSGRSYTARRVFEDVGNERGECFDLGVWVTVGANYRCEDILLRILNKVLKITDGGGGNGAPTWFQGDEDTARRCLLSKLSGRRYMLVLDDVWDTQIWDYLFDALPTESNGSLVLLTTSLRDVALHPKPFHVYNMYDEVSNSIDDVFWNAFRAVLFRWGPFPPELEEAGRKIIRNCRGLRIVMSKVLLFLWSADRTPEAWNLIADDEHHPLFHVDDEQSERTRIKEDLINLTFESVPKSEILYNIVNNNGTTADIEFTKKLLFPKRFFPKMEVISFVGMAGIGKTTLVQKISEYGEYLFHFDHYVWITLGPKYQSQDILKDILAQIDPNKMKIKRDDHDLSRELSNKRFFLVLDDVWDEAPLRFLANLFPNIKGRAMVTTRMANVAHSEKIDLVCEMHLLNKKESWDLLCRKVFGKGLCPLRLEKSGKKIAENCDGLPLTIVKVANLLSNDLSPQYWNDVAKKNLDFKNVLKRLSNKQLPSYKRLPHYLKLCFLYMGAFPENYEVSTSKLVNLWIADGFLEPDLSQRVEDYVAQCLSELTDRSLLMVCQEGTSHGVYKTTRLHSIFWHLSNSEAEKNDFFHVFNSTQTQGIKKQRRFCIHNCILFSFEGIHDSMRDSILTARSLLCSGPYHQYPPPTSVCFKFRLLRVLDTLAIRFYEFPIEVVGLIQLRYLAITCNGKIPAFVSKLLNLQFLIVSHHLRIKSFGDCWYLPMEIWDMKELRHLQVSGSILPTPTCGDILPNLKTLLDVSPLSCSEEVLRGIPNLNKLGIQMELAPDDDSAHYIHYMTHLSNLSKLESLKCVVLNPEIVFEDVGRLVTPPALLSVFSTNLEKLSLSGLGYPWACMNSIIHKLKNLKVLKLRCYAFKGHTWHMCDYCTFEKLEYILIEDMDLVCWETTICSFGKLRHLSIKHCYNLEQLPAALMINHSIEVVDCNPYAMDWAKQVLRRKGAQILPTEEKNNIHIECSWDYVSQTHFQRNTPREMMKSLFNIP
ncbi:hypothetical protein C2S53_014379 [Perilla frutescens var. hirtella]|uniref:NB-ARC domain-containing protein n=1 Tax=Perilla frutescens var. hirtella TaxID=608512 RepID=A0AAD4PAK5_PERFH|nr:hypothetical protein C2S53_014379 [Perilla frutescens var. hirtella]